MTSDAAYRSAAPEDIKGLFNLLVTMHAESAIASLSPERALARIASLIEQGIVIIAERGDVIVGSVGLGFDQWWYSDDWHLRDFWTYVHPEHRHSSIGANLIRLAKCAAQDRRVPLCVGVFSDDGTERKNKLFRRHMTPVGETFIYRS